jgi:putative transposase
MWTPHNEYLGLSKVKKKRIKKYRALFTHQIEGELLTDIRMSANRGIALGSERFKDEIEALGNRRQRLLKRGPKTKT